jgi:hypothetical protein
MKKLLTAGLLAVMSTAALAADAPPSKTTGETASEEVSEPLSLNTPLVGGVTVAETVVIGAAIIGAAAAASNSGGSSNGGTSGTGGTTGTSGTTGTN